MILFSMRLALIGYGRMGHAVEQVAQERSHTTVSIDPNAEVQADYTAINEASLQGCDCCIDFTHPSQVIQNARAVNAHNLPLVIGTTGFNPYDLPPPHKAFLYAPNFSIGMNLFSRLAAQAAVMMDAHPQYDVAGIELHHRGKADAPSGTAKLLAGIIAEHIRRKNEISYEKTAGIIPQQVFQFSSVRVGSVPGTHTIIFDSPSDTIEITHRTRDRLSFAYGAVIAAEWLQGKHGEHTLDDMIDAMEGRT